VGAVIVSVRSGAPVAVRDVALVREGFGDPTTYVSHQGGHRRIRRR
jgi:multidrug efflux pump subunit AcrB